MKFIYIFSLFAILSSCSSSKIRKTGTTVNASAHSNGIRIEKLKLSPNRNLKLIGKCEEPAAPIEQAPRAREHINFSEPKELFSFSIGNANPSPEEIEAAGRDVKLVSSKDFDVTSGITGYRAGNFKAGPYSGFEYWLVIVSGSNMDSDSGPLQIFRFAHDEATHRTIAIARAFTDPRSLMSGKNGDDSEFTKIQRFLMSQYPRAGVISLDSTYILLEFGEPPACITAGDIAISKKHLSFGHSEPEFEPNDPIIRQEFWGQSVPAVTKPQFYLDNEKYGKIFVKGYFFKLLLPDGVTYDYRWNPPLEVKATINGVERKYSCFMSGGKREEDVPITESVFTGSAQEEKIESKLTPIGSDILAGQLYQSKQVNPKDKIFQLYQSHYSYGVQSGNFQAGPGAGVQMLDDRAYGSPNGAFTAKEFHDLVSEVYARSPFGDFFECADSFYYTERWAEPLVYLYSPFPEVFHVTPSSKISLTVARPKMSGRTWSVRTISDGKLESLETGETVPYLFWEGDVAKEPQDGRGFVISSQNSGAFFKQQLRRLGLYPQEIRDFLAYWYDNADAAPFYFVHFASTKEVDRRAPLDVMPAPNVVIRISVQIKPVKQWFKVIPQQFDPTPVRTGRVLVEWGIVPGKSI